MNSCIMYVTPCVKQQVPGRPSGNMSSQIDSSMHTLMLMPHRELSLLLPRACSSLHPLAVLYTYAIICTEFTDPSALCACFSCDFQDERFDRLWRFLHTASSTSGTTDNSESPARKGSQSLTVRGWWRTLVRISVSMTSAVVWFKAAEERGQKREEGCFPKRSCLRQICTKMIPLEFTLYNPDWLGRIFF